MVQQLFGATQDLQVVANDLANRITDWEGLDPSRFGRLQHSGTATISSDRVNWYDVDCFSFDNIVICVLKGEETRHYVMASGIVNNFTRGIASNQSVGIQLHFPPPERGIAYVRFRDDDVEQWRVAFGFPPIGQ